MSKIGLDELAKFPRHVSQLLEGLSSDQLTVRPTPEEFSLSEHVCHLRDIEREGYAIRIHRLLSEENPRLPDVDGARLALERDYNRENIVSALEAFTKTRRESVDLLATLDDLKLARMGMLEGVGEVTLKQLTGMMAEHDASHLEEMISLRRRLLGSASI